MEVYRWYHLALTISDEAPYLCKLIIEKWLEFWEHIKNDTDYPEIVDNIQALFNQDNGTGRVVDLSGSGFLHSYDYISRWLAPVPRDVSKHIETEFPGSPGGGGTDHASFVAAGAPAFNLSSLSWAYWDHTWHTNLDT